MPTLSRYRRFATAAAAALAIFSATLATTAAQQTKSYATRLSPVPLTIAMQEVVAGVGSVTAVLAGDQLTLTGTFDGLRSPATIVRLHVAPRGIRGPAFADLMVPSATSGSFKAVVRLSDSERQALDKSSVYIQLHSEKAPEGNLWGWLVPQEVKR
jgi:CHRD domain